MEEGFAPKEPSRLMPISESVNTPALEVWVPCSVESLEGRHPFLRAPLSVACFLYLLSLSRASFIPR